MFLEIVSAAEELDVIGGVGSPTFRVGDYVVKVEVQVGAALDAFAAVALPDFLFYPGWDYTAMGWLSRDRNLEVFFSLNGAQFELKDLATVRSFPP